MSHLRFGRRVTALAVAAILVVGCSPAAPTAPDGGVTNKTIGLANADLQFPFFEAVRQGVVAEAKKQGYEVIVQSATSGAQQATQIDQMLAQGISALIYLPTGDIDPGRAVRAANDAGVPVVMIDRDSDTGDVVTFIAADSVPGSKEACEYLAEGMGGKGELIWIQGQVGTTPFLQRTEGCNAALEAYPDIEIVGKIPADWSREKGFNAARDLLQANPNVTGIFGMSDDMAIGAAAAADAAGLDVFVVGFDGLPAALQAIKDGKIEATALQPAFNLGERGADAAIKAAEGKAGDIPRIQMVPTILVTQDNVDEYLNKGYYGTQG